jgi:hypothetical protein
MADLARTALSTHKHGWLSRDVVLYDFCTLLKFTGSRLAEFGQSGLPPGSPSDGWNHIPDSRDVPVEWRGRPMAFIASDFSFFDKRSLILSHAESLAHPDWVRQVHVRFCYDKSNFNFSIRKFRCVPGHHLCPMRAILRILARAYLVNSWTRPRSRMACSSGTQPHFRSGGGPTPTISWEQTCRKTGSIAQEGERGQSPRSPGIGILSTESGKKKEIPRVPTVELYSKVFKSYRTGSWHSTCVPTSDSYVCPTSA